MDNNTDNNTDILTLSMYKNIPKWIKELMKRLSELPKITYLDGQEYIQLYDAMETVKRAVEQDTKSIPYLMHKEMDIPLSECEKAYEVAIDYLRSQGKLRG